MVRPSWSRRNKRVQACHRSAMIVAGDRRGRAVRVYQSPLQTVNSRVPADLTVLNNRGLDRICSILIPCGGGPHAQLGLEIAVRIAETTEARVDLLRIVRPGVDRSREQDTGEAG